ncbi:MAG: hypothetical protein WBE72_12240 [Terracidiphilus sp.]
MKRIAVLALCVLACGCCVRAQVVDTTVCAVLKDPASFNGKMVRIKGTVAAGLDQFIIKDQDCGDSVNAIWLDYPQGTKGKAGPLAVLELQPAHNFTGTYTAPTRTPVTLEKSKDFKQFDSLLSQPHIKDPGICLACAKNEVNATLTGRLDGVADANLKRDASGKIVGLGGFGNMNAYPARLVLESVADVSAKAVDFSNSDSIVKGEPVVYSNTFDASDPTGIAEQYAKSMGSDAGALAIQRDAAAYGKRGENNGVQVGFGTANEAAAKDEAQGTADSPDGVLYNCTFDNIDRLVKPEQAAVVIHMGQHIYDLRNMPANEIATAYVLENNAWVITVSAVARMGEKFLTLPGGYLFFSSTWGAADRDGKMEDALTNFLTKDEFFAK